MMSGFQHDLAGGQGVITTVVFQSPDYVPGVSGWAVFRDGSAEFNNVTIRGATVQDGTALYYSPSPGAGHLIASIAAAAGTDQYGNQYPGAIGVELSYLPPLTGTLIGNLAGTGVGNSNLTVMELAATATAGGSARLLLDPLNGHVSTTAAVILGDPYGSGATGQLAIIPPSGDTTGAADAQAINDALSRGWAVQLLPARYYISTPISVPTNGFLRGAGAGLYELAGTVITATAGFAGSAMIKFPEPSQSQEIAGLCLDGSAMPAGTANGIGGVTTSHSVLSVRLADLFIKGAGLTNGIGDVNAGTTWRGRRIFIEGVHATAFNVRNCPDSCWVDCSTLSAGSHGWQLFGAANTTLVGCRAEWSAGDGFHLAGSWGTGNGSGGIQFVDCSTDRNTGNGVDISATGTAPVTFSGLMTRRDGNGTGDAGVHVAAGATVVPVIISGWQCFPGVNDDGSGTLTPTYALDVSGAVQYLGISNAYLHSATTGTNGMTALNNVNWRAVATRTGSTSAPGAITLVADSA